MQSTPVATRSTRSVVAGDVDAVRRPPMWPRTQRLSGRPSCRIYRGRRAWILQFESGCGGWIEPCLSNRAHGFKAKTLAFCTLAEAVGYAERHGYDYRIEPPPRRQSSRRQSSRKTVPRSWLARLAVNGRSGDMYEG
jgi:hypothetical protein